MEFHCDFPVVCYMFILGAPNWMLAANITFTITTSMPSWQLIVSIKVLPCMDHIRAKPTHRGVRPSTSSILPCAKPTGPRIEQERHARANKCWAVARISCRVRGDIGVELINIAERWCCRVRTGKPTCCAVRPRVNEFPSAPSEATELRAWWITGRMGLGKTKSTIGSYVDLLSTWYQDVLRCTGVG